MKSETRVIRLTNNDEVDATLAYVSDEAIEDVVTHAVALLLSLERDDTIRVLDAHADNLREALESYGLIEPLE